MESTNDELMIKFIDDYNRLFNTPNSKATKVICQQYKREHPNEFMNKSWSIEKHRKRFMDWMSKQRPETLKSFKKMDA